MVPWMRLSAAQAWQNTNPGVLSTEMTRNEDTQETRKSHQTVLSISCNILQYLAISCNILQYLAISCNILQYLAISCNLHLMSFWPWCIALWNLPRLWWPRREVRHTQLWRKEWGDEKWMKSGWIYAASSFIPVSAALYKSMAPLTPLAPLFMKAWHVWHVWHVWDEVNAMFVSADSWKAETGWNRLKPSKDLVKPTTSTSVDWKIQKKHEETQAKNAKKIWPLKASKDSEGLRRTPTDSKGRKGRKVKSAGFCTAIEKYWKHIKKCQ